MKNRLKLVVLKYAIVFVLLITYYFVNKYTGFGIPCYFKLLTGYDCAGCGITRCIFSLFRLDFKGAFHYNPLALIYLPFVVVYIIYKDYLYVYDKEDKILVKIPSYFQTILIVITVMFGIIRNFV